ncbi:MAG: M15 family metallopeptidase [Tepidisphaeraceae bacterium]
MSRALNDLDPRFRPLAIELIAQAAEAGIALLIVETRRTEAQHTANLANGVSWILHSKHLDGLAIDVCPYLQYDLHGPDKLAWNASDPVWEALGVIGKRLGLRWGGDWTQKDLGHFEFVALVGITRTDA